jgi:dipeptide transport system permease protein
MAMKERTVDQVAMDDRALTEAHRKKVGTWWYRVGRKIPWLPLIILTPILFVTFFANLVTSHDPTAINLQLRFTPPFWQTGGNSEFILGTDTLGRDLLTRLFFGARTSLLVADRKSVV